jgi:hypothetical protein
MLQGLSTSQSHSKDRSLSGRLAGQASLPRLAPDLALGDEASGVGAGQQPAGPGNAAGRPIAEPARSATPPHLRYRRGEGLEGPDSDGFDWRTGERVDDDLGESVAPAEAAARWLKKARRERLARRARHAGGWLATALIAGTVVAGMAGLLTGWTPDADALWRAAVRLLP